MSIESDIHTLLTTFRQMERDWYRWRSIINKTRKRIERSIGKKLALFDKRTSEVLKACGKEFICSADEIIGSSKPQHIADARHAAMWILVKVDRMTTIQVASIFERDHSCVCHAIKKVNKIYSTEPGFKTKIDRLKKGLTR